MCANQDGSKVSAGPQPNLSFFVNGVRPRSEA
jgi:hypothetical protein